MLKCTFSDVSERDMDLLIMEELATSQEFLDIFLSKVDLLGAEICEVEQSKTDVELGESDITVIVEKDGKRYGLLIEDKIDAIAQENQAGRYFKRGEKGIETGDYVAYYVFIVAPKAYLEADNEAKKYPNQVSYEECLEYFSAKVDNRSLFKKQQIEQAIAKQKHGYIVIENKIITRFWQEYVAYQKAHHPKLNLQYNGEPKGSRSVWVTFHTSDPRIKIIHKSEKGYVDLEFAGLGEKTAELKELLVKTIGKLWDNGLSVEQTGKSAVLRIKCTEIDFRKTLEEAKTEVEEALNAVEKLYYILDDIPERELNFLIR